ncbi:cytochrome P450, partial [Vararia minispora EC-137]
LILLFSTFTLAGSDTTSNTPARVLYLLALHSKAQEKLREGLMEACSTAGETGHNDFVELPYLEAVCCETLHFTNRGDRYINDSVLPFAQPYIDIHCKEHNELFVLGGAMLFVSNIRVNRDKAIWGPDAYNWKPERWLSPLPDGVAEARIPDVYTN